jgi:hypothetical protein
MSWQFTKSKVPDECTDGHDLFLFLEVRTPRPRCLPPDLQDPLGHRREDELKQIADEFSGTYSLNQAHIEIR